jgi:hypothetical protein
VVIGLVMGLVVVMPKICGCGLVPTGLVWLTKPFGALAIVGADPLARAADLEARTQKIDHRQ